MLDFSVRKWADAEKTVVKYFRSECDVCHRAAARREWANLPSHRKLRRNIESRAHRRRLRRQQGVPELGARVVVAPKPNSVRREPFAAWLRGKLKSEQVAVVSERTGLPERRIHALINGYDHSGTRRGTGPDNGRPKRSKLRPIDWVDFDTVDNALARYGEPEALDALYPVSEDWHDSAAA